MTLIVSYLLLFANTVMLVLNWRARSHFWTGASIVCVFLSFAYIFAMTNE